MALVRLQHRHSGPHGEVEVQCCVHPCVLSCWSCTLWKVSFLVSPVYVLVQVCANLLAENLRTVLTPSVPADSVLCVWSDSGFTLMPDNFLGHSVLRGSVGVGVSLKVEPISEEGNSRARPHFQVRPLAGRSCTSGYTYRRISLRISIPARNGTHSPTVVWTFSFWCSALWMRTTSHMERRTCGLKFETDSGVVINFVFRLVPCEGSR